MRDWVMNPNFSEELYDFMIFNVENEAFFNNNF